MNYLELGSIGGVALNEMSSGILVEAASNVAFNVIPKALEMIIEGTEAMIVTGVEAIGNAAVNTVNYAISSLNPLGWCGLALLGGYAMYKFYNAYYSKNTYSNINQIVDVYI